MPVVQMHEKGNGIFGNHIHLLMIWDVHMAGGVLLSWSG